MKLRLLPLLLILVSAPALAKKPAVHASAPAFTLPTRTGTVSLDSLRGRVVLVDFWASWCGPCRQSFPWMAEMQERYASQGLTVVAINLDEKRDLADAFLAEQAVPFTIAFDPRGKTAEAFGVHAMPSSFLVARDGTLLYSHAGFDAHKSAPLETLIHEACAR